MFWDMLNEMQKKLVIAVTVDKTSRVIADTEILNAVQCELNNPTATELNMNNINTT